MYSNVLKMVDTFSEMDRGHQQMNKRSIKYLMYCSGPNIEKKTREFWGEEICQELLRCCLAKLPSRYSTVMSSVRCQHRWAVN